jgi:hypothetical protein
MQQHVLRNLTCDQSDEGALYYCPPRTVTRKMQVGSQLQSGQQSALEAIKRQRAGRSALDAVTIEAAKKRSAAHHAWEIQPTSSGSHFWRNTETGETRWTSPYAAEASGEGRLETRHAAEAIDEEVLIGCANSRNSERRCKRYTYLEYMNARVQVCNTDTGADEWRHYCPWCLKVAETRSKQTGGIVDGSLLPQLKKYTGAAVSVEDLDEVLRPVRLLLADLNPDHLVIPVDSNGVLFEDAMDKFETE